jgi:hypothetical protein
VLRSLLFLGSHSVLDSREMEWSSTSLHTSERIWKEVTLHFIKVSISVVNNHQEIWLFLHLLLS